MMILLLCTGTSGALAQDLPLDPTATPGYGIVAGGAGFQPDPFNVSGMSGGGDVDVHTRNLGTDCLGMITVQPTFRFKALTAFSVLRFLFISDAVIWDASLIVRDPQGNFHCNNDSYGLKNPTVEIDAGKPGDYNIWVGALTDKVVGDLYVTTRSDITPTSNGLNIPPQTPTPTLAPTATSIPQNALNPTLYAVYGTENLAAGFLPDPYFRVVSAGGALYVPDSVPGDDCAGFAPSAPAFRVNWTGQSTRLRFLFDPLDTSKNGALVVQDPAGGWSCNRDFAGGYFEPQIDYVNPIEGTYNVWVSDETAPNEAVMGLLYVTEKEYSPETVPARGTAPTQTVEGLTTGTSAFAFDSTAPDPLVVPKVVGGGAVDVGSQNKDCPGTYPDQPSFAFTLPQALPYLRAFFVSDDAKADATLIVRMPDGTWYCADDSFQSKQPQVDVIGNMSTGAVSVWVGNFKAVDSIPGTLYLTRGGANPLDPTRPAPVVVGQ